MAGEGTVLALRRGAGVVYGQPVIVPAFTPLFTGAGTPYIAASQARALIEGYTGNLCQVMRASDSALMEVPQSGDRRADTAAVVAWAAGSETRTSIVYDQTGGGRHEVYASWAVMPLFDAAKVYGDTNWDGAFIANAHDGWYQTSVTTRRPKFATWAGLALNRNSLSVFNVFDPKSALYNQTIWDFGTGSGVALGAAATFASWYYGDTGNFTFPETGHRLRQNMQVLGSVFSASDTKAFVDEIISAGVAKGAQALTSLTFGSGRAGTTGTSDFIDGSNHLALVVYSTPLSDANAQAVRDSLNANFGLKAFGGTLITYGDDSNGYGANVVTSLQNRTPTREMRNRLSQEVDWFGMALSSQNLTGAGGMAEMAPSREDMLLASASHSKKIALVGIGGNDLFNFGTTPGFGETLYNAYAAYVAGRRAAGATHVVACTIMPRQNYTGQRGIEYADFNSRLLAGKAGADRVADRAAWFVGNRADYANTDVWQGDGVHVTGLANAGVAEIVAAQIQPLLN